MKMNEGEISKLREEEELQDMLDEVKPLVCVGDCCCIIRNGKRRFTKRTSHEVLSSGLLQQGDVVNLTEISELPNGKYRVGRTHFILIKCEGEIMPALKSGHHQE